MRRLRDIALLVFVFGCSTSATAQLVLPATHPKYQTAQRVFDDLIRAIGDGRTQPHLRLLSNTGGGSMRIAWYSPKQHAITLEEKAYDLCISQGADSLAALSFLLGHELAHYYKDHRWVGDFGNSFADLDVGQTLKMQGNNPAQLIEFETEADYFSGFFGYIAGYKTLDIAAVLLRDLYATYELDAHMIVGYPTLAERQQIAQRSREQLQRMIPLFDAGHRLLLLNRFEEAGRCFDFIARTFPSREILNNAGSARALEAIALFPQGTLRFAYPLELDARTRLRGGGKAEEYGLASDSERRRRLLTDAADFFDRAIKRDPAYTTVYINLACVADLRGEPEDAAFWAGKALRITRRQKEPLSQANAQIIHGIALARSEPADEESARADFAASTSNATLASLNLAVLNGAIASPAGEEKRTPKRETIGGHQALDYDHLTDAPDLIADLPRLGRSQPAINIYARRTEQWRGWVVDTGYSAIALLETLPDYVDATGCDVRIGDGLVQVTSAYGAAARLVAGRQGTYHVYERAGIAFCIDAKEKVLGWMLFGIEE